MKYFIVLTILLAISMHAIVSQETDEITPAVEGSSPNENNTNEVTGSVNESETQPAIEEETPASEDASKNTTESSNTNETAPEDGDDQDNTTTQAEAKNLKELLVGIIRKIPTKCRDNFDVCYANDSETVELRGKNFMNLAEDEICDYLKKGEACLTTEKDGKGCTDAEFTKLEDAACSATRGAVVSLLLVALLGVVSKIISQH